jgi:hypothetical protein
VSAVNIVAGIAILGLVIYRQVRLRPVRSSMRIPGLLAVIGIIELASYLRSHPTGPVTVAILAGSLALAAIFGAIRAATVRLSFRDGQWWSRGSWLTAALWVGLAGRSHWLRRSARARAEQRPRQRGDPAVHRGHLCGAADDRRGPGPSAGRSRAGGRGGHDCEELLTQCFGRLSRHRLAVQARLGAGGSGARMAALLAGLPLVALATVALTCSILSPPAARRPVRTP